MLKETVNLEEIGKETAEYLSQYVRIDKVIVYGSYIYGEPRKDSDIDMAVISEDFLGMSVLEKIELLSEVSITIDSRIEVKGFSRDEYDHPLPGSLLEFVKQRGKEIML